MTESTHFTALQQQLAEKLGLEVIAGNADELINQLTAILTHLILNDINRLLLILYRVDLQEEKVLTILRENPIADAARLLAEALISRQLQKIQSRIKTGPAPDIPEDEKW